MGTFAIMLRFLASHQHVFRLLFHACNLLYVTSPQKQVTDVSLVLKDSDMDSENLSSLIRLSVSDDQKTDSSKVSKVAKIRNRYNQVPHLTQDTNGKVTNSRKTPQTRAKRSALSQQVTTKHI